MPGSRAFRCLAALSALLAACACTPQANNNGGYSEVQTDITYGANDRRAREWDALMAALDRCHVQGYADAQRAVAPQTRCLDNGPDGCRRYAAHLSWDCIGMGYQPN
jgi:hypothetical protein